MKKERRGSGGSYPLHQEIIIDEEAGVEHRNAQSLISSIHLRTTKERGSSRELKTRAFLHFRILQAMLVTTEESSYVLQHTYQTFSKLGGGQESSFGKNKVQTSRAL
jgi:hypothetical protein